jgi:hypothetical protein
LSNPVAMLFSSGAFHGLTFRRMPSISSAVTLWDAACEPLGGCSTAASSSCISACNLGKKRSANNPDFPWWVVWRLFAPSHRCSGGIVMLSGGTQLRSLAHFSSFQRSFCLCAVAATARLQLLFFALFTVLFSRATAVL